VPGIGRSSAFRKTLTAKGTKVHEVNRGESKNHACPWGVQPTARSRDRDSILHCWGLWHGSADKHLIVWLRHIAGEGAHIGGHGIEKSQ
jgi:hypothetical protein